MIVFAKKTLNVLDWTRVRNQIVALQTALGAPHDVMMFSAATSDPIQQDIYIGLPELIWLTDFPGFDQIDRASLPDFLATLVLHEDGFEQRFPDIFQKLCNAG
jgi:hypothetical protein